MKIPDSWHGDWRGLNALVLGLGKSGFSVVDTLVELGVKTAVVGDHANQELIDLTELIGSKFLPSTEISVLNEIGFKPDFVVVSPGFSPNHPLVKELEKLGTPLMGDIDLAFRLRDKNQKEAKWVTVTGTNGKTTVSELTATILVTAGFRAVACGNIGTPILDIIRDPVDYDFLVVEISSFQLHYLGVIAPVVSAYLNIAQDHLDWHGSFDEYAKAKAKVFLGTETAIIFNEQDQRTLNAARAAEVQDGCRAISFSLAAPQVSSVGYIEDLLVDRAFLDDRGNQAIELCEIQDIEQISAISSQLLANCAAAAAITRALGVEPRKIKESFREFKLSPHRNQFLAEVNGVRFINDSKATNAHAAKGSLESLDSVVWVLGGLLKGVDPEPMILANSQKIRAAVLLGSETSELEELFQKHLPDVPVVICGKEEPMRDAIEHSFRLAKSGDTVLLAPMAASMDQFVDYADRGDQFIAAVRKLEQQ